MCHQKHPRVPHCAGASQNLGAVSVFYSRQVKSSGYLLASQRLKESPPNQWSNGSCLLLLPAHTVVLSPVPCGQEVCWSVDRRVLDQLPENPAVPPPAQGEQEMPPRSGQQLWSICVRAAHVCNRPVPAPCEQEVRWRVDRIDA
jgi:hypothetical protein